MVPDVALKFQLDGRDLTLRFRSVPFSAWDELDAATSLTPKTLLTEVSNWRISAVVAAVWLERKQRERRLTYQQVHQEIAARPEPPEFELTDALIKGRSLYGGEEADEAEGDDVDPTTTGNS